MKSSLSFFISQFLFSFYNKIMEYIYQSIILHTKDIAEADRIYTIYTKEAGKMRVVGKGTRRPRAKLAGFLEPVTWSQISIVQKRGLGKITGAVPVNNFSRIKSNFSLLEQVFFAFQSLDKLVSEQEKDEALFYLLVSYLECLENIFQEDVDSEKIGLLTCAFLSKLLNELGYKLELYKCVKCERALAPEGNYFSVERGGVLCLECHAAENRKIKAGKEVIKLLRIFSGNKLESIAKIRVSRGDMNNLRTIILESLRWIAS